MTSHEFIDKYFFKLYAILVFLALGISMYLLYTDYNKTQSMSFACKTLQGYYIHANGRHYCFTSDNLFNDLGV